MDHSALNEGLTLLALSVFAVWILKRIKLPPVLGYLLVGTLIGPYALGWLPEHESIQLLAEIGVVFLLFMIGLEFSLSRLIAMKSTVFGLGSIQVTLSTISGGIIAWLTGIEWQGALVVGGALALSSTAIVAKQLSEQLEMQARHGQLAISILLFQDLAVVPLLVVIPILSTASEQSLLSPLLIALTKGILAVFIIFQVGRRLLRPFYHLVASTHSAEIFTLATLFISLTAAWLTNQLGLSLALGAFLAGLMLSETEYKHQILADIRPFRDVLMGLFFISVGAQLDTTIILQEWFWIALLTLGLIIGKGSVIVILTRLFKYDLPSAFRTGLLLGQAGEFSFAILVVAISNNLITLKEAQPIIAATLLSMLITPVLIRYNSNITDYIFRSSYKSGSNIPPKELNTVCETLSEHVILCGFGRIGQNLANILREMKIQYIALDMDQSLVRQAWEAGENVFFGDSTHTEILKKAEITRANALLITFDDAHIAEHVIQSARSINKDIAIIVRSKDEQHMDKLHNAGASNVVPESFEASMMLAIHVLQNLNIPVDKSMDFVEQARKDEYHLLRGYFRGEESLALDEMYGLHLHTVILLPNSYAVGKSVADINLTELDTTLVKVRRRKNIIESFNQSFQFETGDAIVIEGKKRNVLNTEKYLLTG